MHSMKKMRYLNKIVFINSAHIRYAEVAMDGNVHFTGTQGVGKTTLLRALLFFYNCRKDRLGIRTQGQQAFDDFYLPTSASYIVYEVERGDEEVPFSIVLFRHHNRAAFRFVDAPYSREWFVDQLGVVASDNLTVRQRLHNLGIDFSGIIDRYSQYLDILYGNRAAHLSKDLLKYYLLRSQQYQNIPRIIQNVFLNERVDAGFIKNIIINSVAGEEEEIAVDLNFFRSKLTNFNDELEDISQWSRKNRQGVVEARRDADNIIATSHEMAAKRFALREQCAMLKFAVGKAERDIPILASKIERKEDTIRGIDEKTRSLSDDYDKDRRKLTSQIDGLARDLKKASAVKKRYQEMGIEAMIARAAKRGDLELLLQQKERWLQELKANYQSISSKYVMLADRIRLDKAQYLQSLNEKRTALKEEWNERKAQRLDRKAKLDKEIREKVEGELAKIGEGITVYSQLLHEQEVERAKIAGYPPLREAIDACRKGIDDTEKKQHRLAEKKLKAENQLDSIKNSLELKCKEIENDYALQIKDLESEMARLKEKRDGEQLILDNAKDSLCEWLDGNVAGWERSIGKIADERSVLYARDLRPHLADEGADSLFGVKIDMEAIAREVRTPAMIRDAIDRLNKEITALSNGVIKLRQDCEAGVSEAAKQLRSRQREVQTEIDNTAQGLNLAAQQLKEASLRLADLEEEERQRVDELRGQFDEKIKELRVQVDGLSAERNAIQAKMHAELRKVGKMIAEEEKGDKEKLDAALAEIKQEIASAGADYDARLKELKDGEAAELADSGAEVDSLHATEREIGGLKDSLKRIDAERDKITEYHKDCRELLDHVVQMQVDKKKFEAEETRLREKYEERRQRLEMKRGEEDKQLVELRKAHVKAVASKQQAEEFIASRACPVELQEAGVERTDQEAPALVSGIVRLVADISELKGGLKEIINGFRKRFSQNNTFKFPAACETDEDYVRYAESVEEFIVNDKIKDFQHVTSNMYRDILSRAASDFNILLGRESEIQRIIRDINYDFEKKTFAGVIRSIRLRLERSGAPIIQQLQNITDFWNAHQYELGEVNLFSTDEHSDMNRESIKYLKSLLTALNTERDVKKLPLEQTFALQFNVVENDNETGWVENLRAVGSEGTDILVKALINILLISVFKKRAGQAGDFRLHCMMDEIGRLADENIQGILNFANQRGIFIVNSSPKAHRPLSYRRLYMLSKDKEANTTVQPILSIREAEMM